MGLYLAELASPKEYENDPAERGHILVRYKKENRWAKPCMRFGAFEVPDVEWVKRNYDKYKVWLDYEEQVSEMSKQESLIWVGFLPVGDDNYPEPATDIDDNYPNVLTEEIGSWRVVRTSIGGEEKLELYKKGASDFQLVYTIDTAGLHIPLPSAEIAVFGDKNQAQFVPLSNLVASELTRINADITALKGAISQGFTAVGVSTAANGPAGAAAFQGASGSIPSNPGNTASTKLKTV